MLTSIKDKGCQQQRYNQPKKGGQKRFIDYKRLLLYIHSMPRPIRIQYEHAFYHVMNRGKARQLTFHGPDYYAAFLATLAETYQRFDTVVHAYCLMNNHYHLLIETPHANLDRIMRHINGVYTQRYNRLRRSDGPLFRGRYKAILVDQEAYLLPLFRYISRNPIEMKRPIVENLEDYAWSSYPAYIGKAKSPAWLYRDAIYAQLGKHQRFAACKAFVAQGIDEETNTFYSKGNTPSIIGSHAFRQEALNQALLNKEDDINKLNSEICQMPTLISVVAKVCNVSVSYLINRHMGRQSANFERKLAMYVCFQIGQYRLSEIAHHFGLSRADSVSAALHHVRICLKEDPAIRDQLVKIEQKMLNSA